MAEVQDCPKCRLVNPPTAQRCDCGWDFVSRRQEETFLKPKDRTKIKLGIVGWGIVFGIVVKLLLVLGRAMNS